MFGKFWSIVIFVGDYNDDVGNGTLWNDSKITNNDFQIKRGLGKSFSINQFGGRYETSLFVNFKEFIFSGKLVRQFGIPSQINICGGDSSNNLTIWTVFFQMKTIFGLFKDWRVVIFISDVNHQSRSRRSHNFSLIRRNDNDRMVGLSFTIELVFEVDFTIWKDIKLAFTIYKVISDDLVVNGSHGHYFSIERSGFTETDLVQIEIKNGCMIIGAMLDLDGVAFQVGQ